MRRSRLLAAMVMPVLLLAFCSICSADGYTMPELRVKPPDMPIQRALVKYHDGIETLVIEATFEGEGKNFGWIIPVPSIPQKFESVSPGFLNTLSFQLNYLIKHRPRGLKPKIYLVVFLALPCFTFVLTGWRGGLVALVLSFIGIIAIPQFIPYRASSADSSPRIKLVGKEAIGNYEIFIIEAKGSGDLNTWLSANGFEKFPEKILPTLDDYIKKKWYFATAKLARKNQGLTAPHPIAIQFESEKIVYPMRLTALSPSDLNLELFVIASGEGVPINYNLKKIYCNTFDHKNVDRWQDYHYPDRYMPDKSLGFVGRSWFVFDGRWSGRWRYNQIGHPEAKKLMWDDCVVTRFEGRFSSREMKEDIIFELKDAEPYRAIAYSYQGARLYALKDPAYVFLIGLLILTIYYSIRLSGVPIHSRLKRLAIPFLVLSIVCIVVYHSSFSRIGEKKKVQVLGHTGSEWMNVVIWLKAFWADRGDLKMSDAELLDSIQKESKESKEYQAFNPYTFPYRRKKESAGAELVDLYSKNLPGLLNPYTKEPFIIEDSPGNITVERKDGLITAIILYHQSGSPYRILRE